MSNLFGNQGSGYTETITKTTTTTTSQGPVALNPLQAAQGYSQTTTYGQGAPLGAVPLTGAQGYSQTTTYGQAAPIGAAQGYSQTTTYGQGAPLQPVHLQPVPLQGVQGYSQTTTYGQGVPLTGAQGYSQTTAYGQSPVQGYSQTAYAPGGFTSTSLGPVATPQQLTGSFGGANLGPMAGVTGRASYSKTTTTYTSTMGPNGLITSPPVTTQIAYTSDPVAVDLGQYSITQSDISNYANALFSKYDHGRTGTLSLDELRYVIDDFCRETGIPFVSQRDLLRLFELFDNDGNGRISIGEFKVMLEVLGGIKQRISKGNTAQYRNTQYI